MDNYSKLDDVLAFMRAGEQPTLPSPGVLNPRNYDRLNWLDEEVKEIAEGMCSCPSEPLPQDLVPVLDGLMDLLYILLGAVHEWGFGDLFEEAWHIVHEANMRKFGPGSWKDETGKVKKPRDWVGPEPDLLKLIINHMHMAGK